MMGSLLAAAAGHDLKFRLRIEAGGNPPKDVIDKLNQELTEVNGSLKFNLPNHE